jgi:hypothetical protein
MDRRTFIVLSTLPAGYSNIAEAQVGGNNGSQIAPTRSTRTVQAKLSDITSVKDFGAIGDGIVDDTVAIQAAIDNSLEVFIPAGTYKLSAGIHLRRGLHLYGASLFSTIIDGSSLTGPTFLTQLNRHGAAAADQGLRDATLEQFKIIGNTESNSNNLIKLSHGFNRSTIRSIWFYSCGSDALYIDSNTGYGSYYNTIENCIFGDPSDFKSGADTSLIKGNGIYAIGSANQNTVRGNTFWRIKQDSIQLVGTSVWGIERWTIVDNGIEYSGFFESNKARYGINILGLARVMNISRNYIEFNGFNAFGKSYIGAGIHANSPNLDLTIRDNLFSSNPWAIFLENVDAAVIDGNSWAQQSTYHDIKIGMVNNGTIYIGNNPSPSAISGKYLDVLTASQPKVYGDTACSLLRGTTCMAGKFIPKLFGSATEIGCSVAYGVFERQGNRLRVSFHFVIANLNNASGRVGISGSDGINLPLPGLRATIQYPFKNDSTLSASTGAVAHSNVTLDQGYTGITIVANQDGSFYPFLRQYGSNKPEINLNITNLAVGSVLRGEFTVYV